MKILVTGANGLVGRALCALLDDRGIPVRAAVRSASPISPGLDCVGIGSIDGQTCWSCALAGTNTVVHLAARVHVMNEAAADPLAEFRRVNVLGTLNLARQAAAAGLQRFVFVSSVKVNGELTQAGQAFSESDSPSPEDHYGISKWEAEQGLLQIARETGLQVVIIRPPLVYGPGVKANFAALMCAVQRGWPLPLGAVNNQRSLVALDNLVDFIALCVVHPDAVNQVFLISDGKDVSIAGLIRGIALAAGVPARLWPVPLWVLQAAGHLTRRSEVVQRLCSNLQVDISKAQKVLGWRPAISLSEGLHRAFKGR